MKNFDKVKKLWTEKDLFPDDGFEVSFSAQICKIIKKMRGKKCCVSVNACKDCYKWLQQEYKEPILDDAEKKYLSAVIKPFRDKVDFIRKCKSIFDGREYIGIFLFDEDNANLPDFSEGTMYKGMEAGKEYTLEELGL